MKTLEELKAEYSRLMKEDPIGHLVPERRAILEILEDRILYGQLTDEKKIAFMRAWSNREKANAAFNEASKGMPRLRANGGLMAMLQSEFNWVP